MIEGKRLFHLFYPLSLYQLVHSGNDNGFIRFQSFGDKKIGFTGRRIHGYFAAAYPVVFHHPYVGILVFAVTEYGAQRYIHQFFFYKGIVRLVNTQKLRIKFTVPDDYLYLLRAKDATFKVEFDTYKGNIFNARLEEYLDISTDGTGIPVTITIDDPAFDRAVYDVKPGFTCNIRLASDIAPFIEEKLMNVASLARSRYR